VHVFVSVPHRYLSQCKDERLLQPQLLSEGKCGNRLLESEKLCIMRNRRTSTLSVVAAEDIDAGVVLGQYLGELEHVRASNRDRPRNNGYRLVMKTRPEKPALPVRVSINAEMMGGTMRFVNHSCEPVAEFREVANGRRTTVVVATTDYIRDGDEITVDYGDDLWFVCHCGAVTCRHRDIQDQQDP
jgi:SET domain-containing protein